MRIELSYPDAANTTLKGDYLQLVLEIVLGGVPTVLEVRLLWLFMFLGIVLLQGSESTKLFDPLSQQADLRMVKVGIQLVGDIYLGADIIPPHVSFVSLLELCPTFGISVLIYHSLLHEFHAQGIGFGLRFLPVCPSKKTSLKV